MKLPIQPKTWACPCACIHAAETVSADRRLLMASRFHTPRNVPGRSMKNKPVATYAINNCESRSSRAAVTSRLSRARELLSSSTLISGGMILVLHFDSAWKQDVVFEMYMQVQVTFEFSQRPIQRLVARACAFGGRIPVA